MELNGVPVRGEYQRVGCPFEVYQDSASIWDQCECSDESDLVEPNWDEEELDHE